MQVVRIVSQISLYCSTSAASGINTSGGKNWHTKVGWLCLNTKKNRVAVSPSLSLALQQCVFVQTVVQFSTSYDNLKFITVFTVCLRPSPSARLPSQYHRYLTFTGELPWHLRPLVTTGLDTSGFTITSLSEVLIFRTRATCPTHPALRIHAICPLNPVLVFRWEAHSYCHSFVY
jgi:hypothetical protein